VTSAHGRLDDFNPDDGAGSTTLRLIPRFFEVATGGATDALPSTAFVRLRFQAARDDASGGPDATDPLVDWTPDIARFNALPAGACSSSATKSSSTSTRRRRA